MPRAVDDDTDDDEKEKHAADLAAVAAVAIADICHDEVTIIIVLSTMVMMSVAM